MADGKEQVQQQLSPLAYGYESSSYGAVEEQQMQFQQQQGPIGRGGSSSLRQLPTPAGDEKKDLVAVVATFCHGGTYDPLFRELEQKAPEGRVAVYDLPLGDSEFLDTLRVRLNVSLGADVNASDDHSIIPRLSVASSEQILVQMLEDIASLDPEAVVFNFECCGGCSDAGFPDTSLTLQLTRVLLDRRFMCLFSDFSLKALVRTWDEAVLRAPNPLIKVGEFSSSFTLHFLPERLKESPSAQLAKVGELCDEGEAHVKAMGGTILYSVNPQRTPTDAYEVEVLTVVTKADRSSPPGPHVTLAQHKGSAGHTLIRFKDAGTIMCSTGHWIELVRLDTSEAAVLRVAETTYGAAYAQQLSSELSNAPQGSAKRSAMFQGFAAQMVQTSAPGQYTKKG